MLSRIDLQILRVIIKSPLTDKIVSRLMDGDLTNNAENIKWFSFYLFLIKSLGA